MSHIANTAPRLFGLAAVDTSDAACAAAIKHAREVEKTGVVLNLDFPALEGERKAGCPALGTTFVPPNKRLPLTPLQALLVCVQHGRSLRPVIDRGGLRLSGLPEALLPPARKPLPRLLSDKELEAAQKAAELMPHLQDLDVEDLA